MPLNIALPLKKSCCLSFCTGFACFLDNEGFASREEKPITPQSELSSDNCSVLYPYFGNNDDDVIVRAAAAFAIMGQLTHQRSIDVSSWLGLMAAQKVRTKKK